jgi:hypothetical protein
MSFHLEQVVQLLQEVLEAVSTGKVKLVGNEERIYIGTSDQGLMCAAIPLDKDVTNLSYRPNVLIRTLVVTPLCPRGCTRYLRIRENVFALCAFGMPGLEPAP